TITVAPAAQSYSATISPASSPTLRKEGLTEKIGDLVAVISGQTAAGGLTGDVIVTLNASVTNHLLSTDTTHQTTDALLLLNDPAAQNLALNVNAFYGIIAGPNAIRFKNIPLSPITAGTFSNYKLRFTGIRVNGGSTGPVTATISFVTPVPIAVANP